MSFREIVERKASSAEYRLRRRIREALDGSSEMASIAFIVGCGRSGTNMLADLFSRSWRVELFNEDHPAAFENRRLLPFQQIEL